jgi:enoyl-CoA hydratase/carnithine racemase
MSCDIRVASENARFATPGARNGLLPIGGQISRLFHLLPHGKVLDLLYTGEPMTAQEAHSLGFVSRIVPAGQALEDSLVMARSIADNSPAVVREIKRGVEHSLRHGIDAGELFEWTVAEILRHSPDMEEGIRAFLEKRRPAFADPA